MDKYREEFVNLVENGRKLREELSNLKKQQINENISEARADALKYERLQKLVEENIIDLQFSYYQLLAQEMK